MQNLDKELARLTAANLFRSRRVLQGPQGPEIVIEGRRLTSFCSNDYLGLANHPKLLAALRRGAETYGVGSGAAHLVSGHSQAHRALEEELADFVERPRAILFSTGYMANLAAVTTLIGPGDAVFEDRLNHASLVDGGLLSRARMKRYQHASPEALGRHLAAPGEANCRLVVTDGVFSMDGDLAPLPALADVAAQNRAWLMVDDAHGLGVIGPGGRGSLAYHHMDQDQVPVLVGTLGKAFGTFGAFVAGSQDLVETLIQKARTYIYTTALPPAVAEATRAGLTVARKESWRRERLTALVARFRQGAGQLGIPLTDSCTPIQPLIVGHPDIALAWGEALERRGLFVRPVRPPTVPEGSSRLRITFSATHSDAQVDRLLDALAETKREVGGGS